MLLVITLPVCCCALLKLNLLYMYFFKYYYPCVAPTFPLNGIKKYLTIITIRIIVTVMITKWL